MESIYVPCLGGCDTRSLTDMSRLRKAARPRFLQWVSYPAVGHRLRSLVYDSAGGKVAALEKSDHQPVRGGVNCQPKSVSALGQDGMGSVCEWLVNVVSTDKPKYAWLRNR
jgi:hypothetical protein